MKTQISKYFINGFRVLRIVVAGLSSVSLSLGTWAAGTHNAHAVDSSPLLTNTEQSQASVARMVADIKTAANGTVTGGNAAAAISQVIAANPGVSLATIAAAINALNLSEDALSEAIAAASASFGVSSEAVASAIITESYMSGGKAAADARIEALRSAVGDSVVDAAVESHQASLSNLTPEQLNAIASAGGDNDDGGVYNG